MKEDQPITRKEMQALLSESEKKMEKRVVSSHQGISGSVSSFSASFNREINKLFWKVMSWLGIPLVFFVVTATGMWYRLEGRVSTHDEILSLGDRYTQEEHDTYSIEVDRRFQELNNDISEIKVDVKDIRRATVGY